MEDIYAKLVELRNRGENCVLCIVTETRGSVPRKAGARMAVTAGRRVFGTIGGGNVEFQVIEKAMEMLGHNVSQKISFDLEEDSEMHCGGAVEVYIESIVAANRLYIFGAGHVGSALAGLAKEFGFRVTLIDNRDDLLAKAEENGFEVIRGAFVDVARNLETNDQSYLVVTTPKHKYDEEVTGILGKKVSKYLGMIGSRKKVAGARKSYIENKILTEAQINRIDMPIGLSFNAQTPGEIAVSILAKLIDVKNN